MDEENPIVLTEAQVRAIIQDELSKLNVRNQQDRTIHQRDIQILDGRDIQLGRTNGTMIGTADDQKIGFYGITPVVQPSSITAPSGSGTAGVDTPARTAIDAIIAALKSIGITK